MSEEKDFLLTAQNLWQTYQKKVLTVVGAIVVVIGGYYAYSAFIVAPKEQKAQEAQELLQATKNFESHFSQLFEVASFSRTHDRNARGEGMATYYGFGNVPYAAEALVSLKNDRSLNESQQNEVRWLSERIANRLLNMMRSDKRFTDDPRYNVLAGIALQKLDSSFGHSKRK